MLRHRARRRETERQPGGGRDGFTLIEVLITIGIISILAALIVPAVMQTRSAARRTYCVNNARNLGVAMAAAADVAGRYPASGYYTVRHGAAVPSHNWVVALLPYLDRADIHNQWNFDAPLSDPGNAALAALHLRVLACPDDITLGNAGDLSYVVNGGFGATTVWAGVADCPTDSIGIPLDLNGNGVVCPGGGRPDGTPDDKELYLATGVFFLESFKVPGTVRHHAPSGIIDGLSQTIFIAENARAGFDPVYPQVNWASADAARNSFFLPAGICNDNVCAPGNVDYRRANRGERAINRGLSRAEGEAPWPNSFHPGGVYVVFGDGRVTFLSQDVDGRVYAALVSPRGTRIRGPLAQQVLSDGDY